MAVLNQLKSSQSNKELLINGNENAMSPAAFGGNNNLATVGLNFGVFGGNYQGTLIANTVLSLQASSTNYIYFDTTSKSFKNSTSQPGSGLLAIVVTGSTNITSITDRRDPSYFSTGGGSSLSLYKENGTPDTAPIASGNKSVAIGDGAQSTADYSVAIGAGAQSKAQSSFSFGQNNNVYMRMSAILAGAGNALNSGEYAVILGGQNNSVTLNGSNASIIGSYSCYVTNYGYASIINSNQSSIAGSGTEYAIVMGGLQSYITDDASRSFLWGVRGRVVNSYSCQFSFGSSVYCQKSGLSTSSSDASEQEIFLGDNDANIHRYRIDRNMAQFLKVTVLGFSTSGNAVKFSGTAVIKRHDNYDGGNPHFAGTTDLSISLTKDISDSAFDACTARMYIDGTDLKIAATGIASTNIKWSAIIDTEVACRS